MKVRMPEHRLSDGDAAILRRSIDDYSALAVAGQWDVWVGLFTEDATFMPPGAPLLQGVAEIRRFVDSYPPLLSFTSSQVQISGCEDMAVTRGDYALSLTGPEGNTITEEGKFLWVWEKQPDASWKIKQDIWNTDA